MLDFQEKRELGWNAGKKRQTVVWVGWPKEKEGVLVEPTGQTDRRVGWLVRATGLVGLARWLTERPQGIQKRYFGQQSEVEEQQQDRTQLRKAFKPVPRVYSWIATPSQRWVQFYWPDDAAATGTCNPEDIQHFDEMSLLSSPSRKLRRDVEVTALCFCSPCRWVRFFLS